jgi:hypothetical protein
LARHFARDDFEALAQMAGPPARPARTPDGTQTLNYDGALAALESLDWAALERLAQRHLDSLDALHTTAPRLTSKMPSNWLLVGLLAGSFRRRASSTAAATCATWPPRAG